MSVIKGECCECYNPLDLDTSTGNTMVCPGCGLLYELVYVPRLQPKKCLVTGCTVHRGRV